MKYLHVIASVDPNLGGPIEGVIQLSRYMTDAGHTVHVASCDDPGAGYVRESPLNVIPLGPSRGTYSYTPRLVPWLREHAHDYQAMVVNGLWQFQSLAVMRALRGYDIPYVVFTHGMLDPWFRKAYPLKHLKKWLYWPWAEYRVLKHADRVLFTSDEERRMARGSFWLYRCREQVVAYGTAQPPSDAQTCDMQARSFLERFPSLQDRRRMLFLSRIHPKKGCDSLIKAFATAASRDPGLHLVMAGPDQMGWRSALEPLAAERGIADRITWTGMLDKDLKWGAFRTADAFILPSHQENFGISVAEALACGVPVLISDKVNTWREIVDEHAGLVDSDDDAGTVRLITRWLDTPESERLDMRRSACQCFRGHFEIGRVACDLLDLIRASVAERQYAASASAARGGIRTSTEAP